MQNEKLCDHLKERCVWIVFSIRQAGKSIRLLELRYTSGPPLQCIHLCVSHSIWRNHKVAPTHSLAAT
jgi:hypothetical protein